MAGILKVDKYQDFNGNDIMTSDGAGNITVNAAALKNTPAFSAELTSNFTIPNATETLIDFNNVKFDTNSGYNTTNKSFTIPSGQGGKYFIGITLKNTGYTASRCLVYLKKNGTSTAVSELTIPSSTYPSVYINVIQSFVAGDVLTAYVYQNSGGNGTLQQNSGETFFNGYKLIGA